MNSHRQFNIDYPEFVPKCEIQALDKFWYDYFTAVYDSGKFSDVEIESRKSTIRKALNRNIELRKEHYRKFKPVLLQLLKENKENIN